MNPKMMLDENTLFYALRYALGRSTGAVDDMDEKIRAHVDEITTHSLKQMCHEISIEADRGTLGDSASRRTWLELRKWLYEQIAARPHVRPYER